MRYLGGKSKIGRKIAPYLQQSIGRKGVYYEPFLGGNNILQYLSIPGKPGNARLSDIDECLIHMYKAIVKGWLPPKTLTEEEYYDIKSKNDIENPIYAFAAYGCSFSGKKWGGYSRGDGRNFANESRNNLIKSVKNAAYFSENYLNVLPKNATVYCDPPYAATTSYNYDIDHKTFYDYCESLVKRNCEVFVSEFDAPEHWQYIFSVERAVTVRNDGNYSRKIDKLYRVTLND